MYNASVDLKIFEPDFFMKFHNNEIINQLSKGREGTG
jgi:hypothetical protein